MGGLSSSSVLILFLVNKMQIPFPQGLQQLHIFDANGANVGFMIFRLEHKTFPDLWEGEACHLAWIQQVRYQEFPEVGVARARPVHNQEVEEPGEEVADLVVPQ